MRRRGFAAGLMRMASAGVVGLVVATMIPITATAAGPIASSSFAGAESPLNEGGAWVHMFSMSPDGVRFQKNNAAFADGFNPAHNNHPAARTTAAVPDDHYSEIVVGHLGSNNSYVGPMVRVQTSGPAVDSNYTWWGTLASGENNFLYRFACTGTSYSAASLIAHAPFADGDRLRLVARGSVIYGIKNGAREFIYNTGRDAIRYATGTTGILAFVKTATLTDATIASWSTGAAPASVGTRASTTFDGVEDPLDEGDRWYPLPGYTGFRKAGGFAIGKDGGHNLAGAWGIAPPPKQYSEVTLGAVATGGGGPIVRIDRSNPGTTGWLLFLWADNPSFSGIYKINPDGSMANVRAFTPTILPGDKWRLAADANALEVFRNGVSQFTFTTDGSYPSGDVGIEALSPAFTLDAWEGGDTTITPPTPPTITDFAPTSGPVGTAVQINGTNFTGATSVTFGGASATYSVSSATVIQASVPSGATTGPISVTTSGGSATSTSNFAVTASPPTITSFAPTIGLVGTSVQINGTNFGGASSVTFNGVSATYSVSSPTTIQATVPSGATTGPISVMTPGGTATSSSSFTVVSPPTITDFAPTSGPVGTAVQINGTNFTGATSVTFGGASATYTVSSATVIQASVPSGATTGPISVTTSGGTANSASSFAVTASPPTITSFAPAIGLVGTAVQINGTNFTGATSVTFGGVSATYTVSSATVIQATVPSGATTGPLRVTTPGGTATSSSSFTVVSPPTITSFSPTSGPVGTSVQINGTNFTGATSVTFNGVSATYTVSSATTIQATVPSGATPGPIRVTTPGGTATSASSFTVMVRLSVTKTNTLGLGNGTVTSTSSPGNPSQINCGSACSIDFAYGTVVTLTATPALLSAFDGWTDCDSSSGTTCTVTMRSPRTVTARFLP